jgi:paired amphipathic helix protein Sin3a
VDSNNVALENAIQPPRPSLSPDPSIYAIDGQAIEPAMQYVQKIKQRCDPEIYKQFLEILSRYHHKPDTTDEVRSHYRTVVNLTRPM